MTVQAVLPFGDPTRASRWDDPTTSAAAERAARLHSNHWMRRCLGALVALEEATAYRVWVFVNESSDGKVPPEGAIQRRLSDLAEQGWIERTGAELPGGYTRAQKVWRATDAGRQALRAASETASGFLLPPTCAAVRVAARDPRSAGEGSSARRGVPSPENESAET